MRRYIEHIKSKEPHERRRHALGLAAATTGVFAVAWLMSFCARFSTNPQVAAQPGDTSQTAAAQTALPSDASQLQISTTSIYSY